METLREIEDALMEQLRNSYSKVIYELWIQGLHFSSLSGSEAVFGVNNEFRRGIIEERYADDIRTALGKLIGYEPTVRLVVEDDLAAPVFREEETPPPVSDDPKEKLEGREIVSEYSFDNFIVGDTNKFAHASALAVAQCDDDLVYNPLFIYGPSGLGKTHLLFAITNELKRKKPDLKLVYKKAEDFTNELIEALKNYNMADFRNKYRTVDVLLIDDIQFLSGKESTQEEFFHTFTTLYEAKKQIILTSDRPPKDIKTLEERLRSRFEWGLIADIQPPSLELRTAIIRKKAEIYNIQLPDDIIDYLASQLRSNIRQIEGAIKKIAAISSLMQVPITMDITRRAIADLLAGTKPVTDTVNRIFNLVSEKYGIAVEEIKGKRRTDSIANARHISIYLLREETDLPQTSIGELFGRDHSTIISSLNRIRKMMKEDPHFREEIELLQKNVRGDSA